MSNAIDIYATFTPDDEPADLQPEMLLSGKYRLIKQIGKGAMGVVWQAHDGNRLVALKFVPKECSRFTDEMERMRQSFNKIHALNHQSICPTYDLVNDDDFGYFLVMKFLEGETLDDYKHRKDPKRNGLPLDQVLELIKPVAQALDYAHRNDVIHRDIKPSNIFLSETAKGINIEIIDFGLADEIGQQFDKAGTPAYMAPEQWQKLQQTAATDQYALAVIVYELLSGFPPFTRNIENAALKYDPELLSEISESANAALQKALAKQGEERFTTCQEFIDALGGAKREPEAVSPQSSAPGTPSTAPAGVVPLMKRGQLALEDSEWDKASGFFDKVLNLNAEYAPAYVGLLCAELKVQREELLGDCEKPISEHKHFQKAVRFADEEFKAQLEGYDEKNRKYTWQEQERRKTQERICQEQERIERQHLEKRRQEITKYRGCIVAGNGRSIGLKSDGSVVAVGYGADGECNTCGWRGIIAIVTGSNHTIGLKSDGTVVAVGRNTDGQCNISNWQDIVMIATDNDHTIGLKSDGTVVAVGDNRHRQCNTSDWQDIVAVAAGDRHTVGLKSDGTVVAVGDNRHRQCNTGYWRDIVAIATGHAHTVGLKSDGTVVAEGGSACNTDGWQDIVAVAACSGRTIGLRSDGTVVAVGDNEHGGNSTDGLKNVIAIATNYGRTIGLRSDGTVVAVGRNDFGQCNTSDWQDIVAVAAGGHWTVGLKSDGTVVAVGNNRSGQCNTSDWQDIGPVDKERMLKRAQEDQRRLEEEQRQREQEEQRRIEQSKCWEQQGLCRHCGGQMGGIFTKKCKSCGRAKD